jgi:hypothetical protein
MNIYIYIKKEKYDEKRKKKMYKYNKALRFSTYI